MVLNLSFPVAPRWAAELIPRVAVSVDFAHAPPIRVVRSPVVSPDGVSVPFYGFPFAATDRAHPGTVPPDGSLTSRPLPETHLRRAPRDSEWAPGVPPGSGLYSSRRW